jgi:hypothetical protein
VMRRALAVLFVLGVAGLGGGLFLACRDDSPPAQACRNIPAGGCPRARGVACTDPACEAVYLCNEDGTWTLERTCPKRQELPDTAPPPLRGRRRPARSGLGLRRPAWRERRPRLPAPPVARLQPRPRALVHEGVLRLRGPLRVRKRRLDAVGRVRRRGRDQDGQVARGARDRQSVPSADSISPRAWLLPVFLAHAMPSSSQVRASGLRSASASIWPTMRYMAT